MDYHMVEVIKNKLLKSGVTKDELTKTALEEGVKLDDNQAKPHIAFLIAQNRVKATCIN